MKLKRDLLIVFLSGVLLLTLSCITPIVYCNSYAPDDGSMGIIGGASSPAYIFVLTSLFDGLLFALALMGISLVLSSLFCLFFSKTLKKHCSVKSSALALGLSGVGAFTWFTIVAFNERTKHPLSYPVSVLLGILSFFAFAVLTFLYFKERKTNWSIIGFFVDALTAIVYLPTFFFGFMWVYEIIS